MGQCVSVQKDPDSAMNDRIVLGSKADKVVIPSPVREKLMANGSKEETFFDSQPWLESDCEDDFFSVNGDFTPSRGSTPVHHSFSAVTTRVNGVLLGRKTPFFPSTPSPKMKLSELFKESLHSDSDVAEQDGESNKNKHIGKLESGNGIMIALQYLHLEHLIPQGTILPVAQELLIGTTTPRRNPRGQLSVAFQDYGQAEA